MLFVAHPPPAPAAMWPPARDVPTGPGSCVLVLTGPIARDDIPGLCKRAHGLLERCDADPVVCDVGGLAHPDAATIDALARLQLTARRLGRRVVLRSACGELEALLLLMGLRDVLPCRGTEPGQASSRAGSPNSGNRCGVSRKKLTPTISPSAISSTWSDQGSRLPSSLGLY
jgi:ABC-type transporter Mla MlaB component